MRLQERHLRMITNALMEVCEYKSRRLKPIGWAKFQKEWLIKAAEQIESNNFVLNHPQKNFFMWCIDQMVWSRRITDGVPIDEGIPLIDTGLGQQVAAICRKAAEGQTAYDKYYTRNTYDELFEEKN